MGSNTFGKLFSITTWGESHGAAIGVVIDGCPAGIEISEQEINAALAQRAPGNSPFTSPRKESDQAKLLSGVFKGKTTGTPLSMLIENRGANPKHYEPIAGYLRPGHATATYHHKYGHVDDRGGGRSSARETAVRVAAGALAQKYLALFNIEPIAYLKAVGGIEAQVEGIDFTQRALLAKKSPLFCPDKKAEALFKEALVKVKEEGDSLGGVVEGVVPNLPAGLGDPLYEKIEAKLASAMLSINASRGFEIGEGFKGASLKGSQFNDLFVTPLKTKTNHAGGCLGGISTGMPLIFRVPFKPTSSIKKSQETITKEGEKVTLTLHKQAAHDPCVAVRAVPVVKAMLSLVLADLLLMNRNAKV